MKGYWADLLTSLVGIVLVLALLSTLFMPLLLAILLLW